MNTFNELFLEAYSLFSDKLFDLAIEKLNEAETIYASSDNAEFSLEDLYILRGTSKFSLKQFDGAKEDFEQALKVNPGSSEACLGLGKYFLTKGLDDNAKKMFEWAVKNNPSHPGAMQALKDINSKLGLGEDDNSLLSNNQNKPEDNSNIIEEASDLFVQKKFEEAIEKLKIAKKDHETFLATIENFIAFNYLGLQNLEKAAEAADNALKINPFSSQAYATLGEIDFMKNKLKSSRTKFKLALSYNMENDFAKQGLGKVDNLLGRENEGESNLEYEKLLGESLYK